MWTESPRAAQELGFAPAHSGRCGRSVTGPGTPALFVWGLMYKTCFSMGGQVRMDLCVSGHNRARGLAAPQRVPVLPPAAPLGRPVCALRGPALLRERCRKVCGRLFMRAPSDRCALAFAAVQQRARPCHSGNTSDHYCGRVLPGDMVSTWARDLRRSGPGKDGAMRTPNSLGPLGPLVACTTARDCRESFPGPLPRPQGRSAAPSRARRLTHRHLAL